MGMLRLRQKQYPDALNFLSRAVDSDDQNHMTHFYYASLLQRLAEDENADARQQRLLSMRTHLRKSIELAPHFIEAYSWLGYVASVLNDELDEAEGLVGKASLMAPGREDLKLTFGRLLAMNHKTAAARTVVGALRNSTADDEIRRQASSLLENIEVRLASEQAQRDYEKRRTDSAKQIANFPEDTSSSGEPPRLSRPAASSSEAAAVSDGATSMALPARTQVTGELMMMDCSHGLTMDVRVGNESVKFHSDDPSKIDFVSFTTDVKSTIACGPVQPEVPVVITYKRSADPSFLGEPIKVEFRK